MVFKPRNIVGGNLRSVEFGPAKVTNVILAHLNHPKFKTADIFAFSEASDVHIEDVLKKHGLFDTFGAVQVGAVGSASSAVAIVYRRNQVLKSHKMVNGVKAGHKGKLKWRARSFLVVRFGWGRVTALHAPLMHTGQRDSYLTRSRTIQGIKIGDTNVAGKSGKNVVTRLLNKSPKLNNIYRNERMAAAVPKWFKSKMVCVVPHSELAGTDHNAFMIRVWK